MTSFSMRLAFVAGAGWITGVGARGAAGTIVAGIIPGGGIGGGIGGGMGGGMGGTLALFTLAKTLNAENIENER